MNFYKKLKALFFKPELTLEDYIEMFRVENQRFMKSESIKVAKLMDAIRGLKKHGYTLEQVLALKDEHMKIPEKYTSEENSNVIKINQ